MGTSIDPSVFSGTKDAFRPKIPRRRWINWPILGLIALVLGPLLGFGIPREIARWYRDAALEAELDEQFTDAIEHIDRAIAWSPRDVQNLLVRAELHLKNKHPEKSLADVQQALQWLGEGESQAYALQLRALVYQRLGDHSAAIRDADRLVTLIADAGATFRAPDYNENFAQVLNQRAYFRAIGKLDLEAALADVQKAIELVSPEEIYAFLDTRGYIYYLLANDAQALPDLERAITLADKEWKQIESESQAAAKQSRWLAGAVHKQERQHRESLAVLHQHRGLVYERLGRAEEAKKDFELAQKMGYDPARGVQ